MVLDNVSTTTKQAAVDTSLRVCFVFASTAIGGAERSMLRLMEESHPQHLHCTVIFAGGENLPFAAALNTLHVPYYRVGKFDTVGIARLFAQIQPHVVYLFGQIRTIPWALAARAVGIRAIVGAERGSGTRWINRLGRSLDKFVLSGYITNSRRTATVLQKTAWIAPQKLHVVYNGIESATPASAAVVDQDLGEPTIACVATIRPLKGQIVLLQAIRLLRPAYPHIRAVLLGRDTTNGRFFQEVEEAGLTDTYTWGGFVTDVRSYLEQADVFVLPSLYREGMPTSILEAMAAGVPVIASQVGGVDELVDHQQTGLLVEPGDPEILAQSIDEVLRSQQLRDTLCRGAYDYVVKQRTMANMVAEHVRIFRHYAFPAKSPR